MGTVRQQSQSENYSAKEDPMRYEAETEYEFSKQFGNLNLMSSQGRQGGSGLIDGAHPLAPKITKKAEPETNSKTEKYSGSKNKFDFPGLPQASNKKQSKKGGGGGAKKGPGMVVDTGPKEWVVSNHSSM